MLYPPLPMHEQVRRPYQPPAEYWDESIIPLAKDEPVPARGKGRWKRAKYEKEGGSIFEQVFACIKEYGPIKTNKIQEKLPGISRRALQGACSDLVVSGKIVYSENESKKIRTYRIRDNGEIKSKLRIRKGDMQERILAALKKQPWMTTTEIVKKTGGKANSISQLNSLLCRRGLIVRREGKDAHEYAIFEGNNHRGNNMRELPRYEFRGKMLTAGEIAAITGRTQGLISSRLFKGVSGEALIAPPMSRADAARQRKAATKT